jgi:tetratricopeptide (TPR) repeat protein
MKSRMCFVCLLLTGSVAAQFDSSTILRHVRVRIAFVNGACDVATHVRLMGLTGPVAEGTANDQCEVDFENLPAGTYRLNVLGENVIDTDVITAAAGSTEFEVKVRRGNEPEGTAGVAASPSVSVADLGIPANARKEFDKANKLISRQDFTKAIQCLNRAIAIYPAYAGAYNNLGVIYARLGDRAREREDLQKAISINDHFAPAYVNLGRMNIGSGDFSGAESVLSKASSFDPTDAMTLVLLTFAEFKDRRPDRAIETSRKAHALKGEHAFAHMVAARAFEQKRDAVDAVTELEVFLKEEPAGPRADIARKELAAQQAIPH